jgi:transcriptional regulator with GAF, ATPase, and Fis domain
MEPANVTWAPASPNQASADHAYQPLVRFSATLSTQRDRCGLFEALADELPSVIQADFLRVVLYSRPGDALDSDAYPCGRGGAVTKEPGVLDTLARWLLQQQHALVIPSVQDEKRFADTMRYFRAHSLTSICACPLVTHHGPVGCLIAGRAGEHTFTPADIDCVTLAANQVAYAIEHVCELEDMRAQLARARERADGLDASDDLLRALSDVLDVRQVFPRLSEIAAKILPHDALTMTFHDGHGNVVIEAASQDTPLGVTRLKCGHPSSVSGDSFFIIDDLAVQTFEVVEPAGFWDGIRADGYRAMLLVGVKARDQQLGLLFWSKQPSAFSKRDVPVARRIADHVALAVSHEQLAEAARQIAEARTRADRLEARVKALAEELDARTGYARVVGRSQEWQGVLKAATQVASTDTTVLLTGESGTGKEVIARFIHRASTREKGPFVALNCAALPEQLLESELFGFERGAFTGAHQAKVGQIELAAGGVLFLDEVAEMSAPAQAKFLRVLQEREFQRLGGTRVLKANVRIIAATNRDLRKAVERREFREDLFYRLQVFDIKLPALRHRAADILPLSEAFLQDIGRMFGQPPAGLTRDAKDALLRHRWPGNVRELRNALERAAILCEGGLITAEHLALPDDDLQTSEREKCQSTDLSVVERDMISRVLRECNGNKSKSARRLGLTRTQLYHRLDKYGLA